MTQRNATVLVFAGRSFNTFQLALTNPFNDFLVVAIDFGPPIIIILVAPLDAAPPPPPPLGLDPGPPASAIDGREGPAGPFDDVDDDEVVLCASRSAS